ncbi:MAG: sulfite exporter TauE/SafE family protein [Gammaproteobacteria bacterium]|nr:MAG: sulfite exporter TauE/SafE family protein [Gammaproteobacteria bacterium]
MDEISLPIYLLASIFFIIAFAYSSLGLGGASTYTALMAIVGMNYLIIPTLSLILNIFVTSIGSFNFIRQKHARLDLIVPFIVSSMPMAYVGGSLTLPKEIFYGVLLVTLVFVSIKIFLMRDMSYHLNLTRARQIMLSLLSGGVLGLIAGIVGIGGGIYLVPLIIILGLGTIKEAAACSAIFVWLNSASGLAARLQRHPVELLDYVPIIVAVILGAALGSYFGSRRFSPVVMEKILGVIILFAIGFLLRKLLLQ